MYLKREEKLQ